MSHHYLEEERRLPHSVAHFKEVYECGHVGSQCRCMGSKSERKIKGLCPRCIKVGWRPKEKS
jgi:hypothetical protein